MEGNVFDFHLADYLLDPTETKRALSDLVKRYFPNWIYPLMKRYRGRAQNVKYCKVRDWQNIWPEKHLQFFIYIPNKGSFVYI